MIWNIFLFVCILIIYVIMIFDMTVKHTTAPFSKVYLINLERRPDRLDKFTSAYMASDMKPYPIIKVKAVDGSTINTNNIPLTNIAKLEMKQLETTGFRYKHYQLTKGAIGCYFSHMKVWDKILKGDDDNVLIFEDDATPPPNCGRLIRNAMKHIPNDWDIVLFGKHCKDCEIKKHYYKVNRFILLHCYMIRKSGIRKILEKNNILPISQQLDAYISEISYDMKIYAPLHDIVMQSESRTDIQAPIVKSAQNDARMNV